MISRTSYQFAQKGLLSAILIILLGSIVVLCGISGGIMLLSTSLPYITFLILVLFVISLDLFVSSRINNRFAWFFKLTILCSITTLLLASQLPNPSSYTGWDVNGEARIFRLVEERGYWNPHEPPHMYNSILSTTILPFIFTQITGSPEILFFKYIPIFILALSIYLLFETNKNIFPKWTVLLGLLVLLAYPNLRTELISISRQEFSIFLYSLFLMEILGRRYVTGLILLGTITFYHYASGFILILGTLFSMMVSLLMKSRTISRTTLSVRTNPMMYVMTVSLLVLITWYWYAVSPSVTEYIANSAITSIHDIIEVILGERNPMVTQMIHPITEPNLYSIVARWLNRFSLVTVFGALVVGYLYQYLQISRARAEHHAGNEKESTYSRIVLGAFVVFVASLVSESLARSMNPGRIIVTLLCFLYPYVGLGFVVMHKVLGKLLRINEKMFKGLLIIVIIIYYISQTGILFEATSSNTFIWPTRLSTAVHLKCNPEATYEALVFVGTPIDNQIVNIIKSVGVYELFYDLGSHMRYWSLNPYINYEETSEIVFLSYANIESGIWRHMNGTIADLKSLLSNGCSGSNSLLLNGEYFILIGRC